MRYRRPALGCVLVVGCLALACLPGCGQKRAKVKGKVVFLNRTLTAGTVAFVNAEGRAGSGVINPDGTYAVNDAPIGDVTITVTTPPPRMGPANMPKPPTGSQGMPKEFMPAGHQEGATTIVPAPANYAKVETSPLKYTVRPGSQDYDIDLKP